MWQQAGGVIVMDADATSALHRRGISPTDDSFKFVWFKVTFWLPCLSAVCWSFFLQNCKLEQLSIENFLDEELCKQVVGKKRGWDFLGVYTY